MTSNVKKPRRPRARRRTEEGLRQVLGVPTYTQADYSLLRLLAMSVYPGQFNGRGREVAFMVAALRVRLPPLLLDLERQAAAEVEAQDRGVL